MNKPVHVAVCFPSGDLVHADFALALATLCNSAAPVRTTIVNAKSSIVAEARNRCVQLAREHACDFMLFLDSDMVFPADTLQRLLSHGKDIVGATYTRRVPPYSALGAALTGDDLLQNGGCVAMKHMPTGCLMIRTSVFDDLDLPHFRLPVRGETIIGEDYDFCDRARARGLDVWCDIALSFEIGHIGQSVHRLPRQSG